MTVAAARPHAAGVKTLLEGAGVLTGQGKVPAGGGWQGEPGRSEFVPYAVLYVFPGQDEPASLGRPHAGFVFGFQVTAVGASQEQVLGVLDQVRGALVGVAPQVEDRAVFPVYQVPLNRPVVPDHTVSPPVFSGVAQFRCRSDPA